MSGVSRLTRVKKLEAVRRTGVVGRFFMLWGSDHTDLLDRIRDALDAGTITPDSPMLAIVWSVTTHPPPCRWVTERDISDSEVRAVVDWVLTGSQDGEAVPGARLPSEQKRRACELTNDELWECIISGSRVEMDQIIRAVLH